MTRSKNVLAPVLMALLLAALAGFVALLASRAADQFLPEQNLYEPPLSKVEPVLDSPDAPQSRRVLLFVIDGLRLDSSFGYPNLDALRRRGIDGIATSHYPSISRPNHVALVTGVPPMLSGVRNNFHGRPVKLDSVMARLEQAGGRSAFVADYATSLAYHFTDHFDSLTYAKWPGGLVKAGLNALGLNYRLVVVIAGGVDRMGHEEGGDSDEYRAEVAKVDAMLGELLSRVNLERDTVIVTADHGHTDSGGHGGAEPVVMEVPIILAGAGIDTEALLPPARLVDVAPTIAALLGVAPPGHGVGMPLLSVLDMDEGRKESLARAAEARIERNRAVHHKALEAASSTRLRRRVMRMLILVPLFLLALGSLVLARRWGAVHIDFRVIVLAVPAFPLCYYGLLDLLGQSLSLSALPDRGEAMDELFSFGLAATGVQLVAGWLALRHRVVLRDRLASANALAVCGLFVAWLPAALLWALMGGGPHLDLPGPTVALLTPASYVAVATYALSVAVLLGLEIVIFFARAVDPRIRIRRLERAAAKERRRLEEEKEAEKKEDEQAR